MASRNRASIPYQVKYAVQNPGMVPRHAKRLVRDLVFRSRNRDHVDYYRAVMASDAARSPERAVGSKSHERWLRLGQMQFDYLVKHGLSPTDRMLDIGCGNLRAGRLFIDYLDPGNYYGIDISPDILLAAQETVAEYELQDKVPHLMLVRDLRLRALPHDRFTVVHAHSVFSHSPLHVIEECFANVERVLAPGGFFDFTFDRTEGVEHHVLRENFWYRTQTLTALAERYGLRATFMDDWEKLPHKQSKIRVTVPTA